MTELPWRDLDRVCLVVDEPEFNGPPVLWREGLHSLRRVADRPGLVLVTVPRSNCLETGPHGDRVREEWASVADVIIEIVPTGHFDEAELHVLRNRQGPVPDNRGHSSHAPGAVRAG